jgi:hypothetical protein
METPEAPDDDVVIVDEVVDSDDPIDSLRLQLNAASWRIQQLEEEVTLCLNYIRVHILREARALDPLYRRPTRPAS